jgi:DNA-directed RNA polymerase subunit M/transcription elongation factor TFIIS
MSEKTEAVEAVLPPEEAVKEASKDPDTPARKTVQIRCRMPNCESQLHYELLGANGVPLRAYECVECGNVWNINLGGTPGF